MFKTGIITLLLQAFPSSMLSQTFETKFVEYLCIASLSIMLWDILDNVKNDYRLLFRHRLVVPTMFYFFSRIVVLGYALVLSIFLTTPFISCTVFETALVAFFIAALASNPSLAYYRVCAVWHWNRFIVGFFGLSWLFVAASGFTLIRSIEGSAEKNYCKIIIVDRGHFITVPFITTFFNHTAIFLAITYGICKNAVGRDLGFRDRIWLMLGEGLPTFSKALLHDSQVSYIIIMVIVATALAWCYVWAALQATSGFRLALSFPSVVLGNIMICRVFRNTKLGLYDKIPLRSSNLAFQTHVEPIGMMTWNSGHNATDAHSHSNTVARIQITTNQGFEYDSPLTPKHPEVDFLDFGTA